MVGHWLGRCPPSRQFRAGAFLRPPHFKMGLCAPCRGAPAVVLRFSCQRSSVAVPLAPRRIWGGSGTPQSHAPPYISSRDFEDFPDTEEPLFIRFTPNFMFRLTKEECLRSQIATLNMERGKHMKYMPCAFTESGVAMLSGVLRSSIAIDVNIRIMRAFVSMRKALASVAPVIARVSEIERLQLEEKNTTISRSAAQRRAL